MSPDLSVIIVNWNSGRYALAAIESVRATVGALSYEVLVVDNASTDHSMQLLARPLPATTLIPSPVNLGFARANNLAAARARGRALLFLNPDTRLLEGALARLLEALDASPAVGVVGARLLNEDGSVQTSCVQAFPTVLNQALDAEWLRRRLPRLTLWGAAALFVPPDGTPAPVEAVSGACLMIRRDVFEQVGGFSEEYFLYAEDLDLCYRVRQLGCEVRHVPGALVVHLGGRSARQHPDDAFAAVLQRESVYRFLRKTRGGGYARRYRQALRASAALRLLLLAVAQAVPGAGARARLSARKWWRILRWTSGLEPWSQRFPAPGLEGVAR